MNVADCLGPECYFYRYDRDGDGHGDTEGGVAPSKPDTSSRSLLILHG